MEEGESKAFEVLEQHSDLRSLNFHKAEKGGPTDAIATL
jgi:hypothetical protein